MKTITNNETWKRKRIGLRRPTNDDAATHKEWGDVGGGRLGLAAPSGGEGGGKNVPGAKD